MILYSYQYDNFSWREAGMPDVALRGIPQSLHRELKSAAKRNHRSLNGEILARLTASIDDEPLGRRGAPETHTPSTRDHRSDRSE